MAIRNNVQRVSGNGVVSVTAAVEVLRDALVADDVCHVFLGAVDRKEALEGLLANPALIRVFGGAVGHQASSEGVRAGTDEPAAGWAEPGEGVRRNGLVPAVLVVFVQDLDAVVGVLGVLLQVVQVHEVGEVHVVVVASRVVEIATRGTAINLEQRVAAAEAAGGTEQAEQVAGHVL